MRNLFGKIIQNYFKSALARFFKLMRKENTNLFGDEAKSDTEDEGEKVAKIPRQKISKNLQNDEIPRPKTRRAKRPTTTTGAKRPTTASRVVKSAIGHRKRQSRK